MDVALPVTESSRICLPVPAGCSGLAHRNPHGLGSLSFRSWFSKDSILVRIGKPSPIVCAIVHTATSHLKAEQPRLRQLFS
jgi:hypothetical protein